MSRLFEKVRKYYKCGLYSKKIVGDFCMKGVITPEEYKIITGDDYVAAT